MKKTEEAYNRDMAMPVITILLPTRGRPFLVKRLFESLARTAADPAGIEVILYLDADDAASHLLGHDAFSVIRIVRPHGSDMGAMFKVAYRASSGRYIMLMNDDAVFVTRGWDERIKAAFRAFPDDIAFVYGNDGDQGEKVPTFPLLSRAACEVMGGVCPAHYRNIHIESHLIDVFRQLKALGHDRIVYLGDVVFEHMHYLVGKALYDNIYAKKNADADQQLFIELDEERRFVAKRLAEYIETAGHVPEGVSLGGCRILQERHILEGCHIPKGEVPKQGPKQEPTHRAVCPKSDSNPNRDSNASEISVIIQGLHGQGEPFCQGLDAVIREADRNGCEVIAAVSALAAPAFLRTLEANSGVKVIYCPAADKPSRMLNAAAFAAVGKYLVFIGPRVVPVDGLIKAFLGAAQADEKAGVIGAKMLNPVNGRIRHAGIGFLTSGGSLKMSHLYQGAASSGAFANRTRELQAVSGECMLVRKDAFCGAGGFNETLGALEDVDLCLKLRRLGMKVIYEPGAQAYYYDGPKDGGLADMDSLSGDSHLAALWPELHGDLEMLLEEDGFVLRKDGRFFRCESVS